MRLDLPVLAGFLGEFLDLIAGEIARHNNDRVLEIYSSAFAVRQPAVVKDLQQYVEHVDMCFFYLVQQDNLPPWSHPTYPGGAPISRATE